MGCGSPQKDLENQIMVMKLERVNIQMERVQNLKLLEEMDGCKRKINSIPDYIDPQFAEEQKKLKGGSAPLIYGGIEANSSKKIIGKRNTFQGTRRKSKKSNGYNKSN